MTVPLPPTIGCPICGKRLSSENWNGKVVYHLWNIQLCPASGLLLGEAMKLASGSLTGFDPAVNGDCPECGRGVQVHQYDRAVPAHSTLRGAECPGEGRKAVNVWSPPLRSRGGGPGPRPSGFHN